MKRIKSMLLFICITILLGSILIQPVLAEDSEIVFDFYYSESCGECGIAKEYVITEYVNNDQYTDLIQINIKDVDEPQYLKEWDELYDYYAYPFVVITSPYQQTNEINEQKIVTSYLNPILDEFLFNLDIIPYILENETLHLSVFYNATTFEINTYSNEFEHLQNNYSNTFTYEFKDTSTNSLYQQQAETLLTEYSEIKHTPFLVIQVNNSIIKLTSEDNISLALQALDHALAQYVVGTNPYENDPNILETPFGAVNYSEWSLPLLTIVLGAMDSFNPCAFFILIFLLNLLIYAQSRKRMMLIGGIFIFFSGLLYALFMFLMYEFFREIMTNDFTLILITVIVGLIVIPMGLLNIKDFFFFKKGASLSIPDKKKPKLYKQMRELVKHKKITTTIFATIVLAATVNFYELLCTLGLPLAFTAALTDYYYISQGSSSYYFYIILYNIVYVIPLLIIVAVFVVTLGKRKLSEWHGQIMKLLSGIMLTLFGLLFVINYKLLENILTPIFLIMFTLGTTAIIALLWKRYKKIPTEEPAKDNDIADQDSEK